ncbi:MAG: glutamate--cysteine ligase [Gammaproteobacteria bacterium]|nr:MAG: glutamate--cysteine ligase [Gammaproteobacteria bacterium]
MPASGLGNADFGMRFPDKISLTRGIEREALRVDAAGDIAKTPHPESLGPALTHPYITLDYAETLPELITPPFVDDVNGLLEFLANLHIWFYQAIRPQGEILWNGSMPACIPSEQDIVIARFGRSNIARMKEIYRTGLGYRYGKTMQMIAGVHYNLSIDDDFWRWRYPAMSEAPFSSVRSHGYMGLIRNFLRHQWLLVYLFGASPSICQSFLKERPSRLARLSESTRYGTYATSLRMSDIGYVNNAQTALNISYNSVDTYIAGLEAAIRTPEPLYQKIGVVVDGEYRQLNANILQIENEFYASVRPKRTVRSGERPAKALTRAGVEYVEVRALDLNPFAPLGISKAQVLFLDCFLLWCALNDSPALSCREIGENKDNLRRVVESGRQEELTLWRENREVRLVEEGQRIFDELLKVAEYLERQPWAVTQSLNYTESLAELASMVNRPDETLSAQALAVVQNCGSHVEGFLQLSRAATSAIERMKYTGSFCRDMQKVTQTARDKFEEVESQAQMPFEQFLAAYFE